VTLLTAWSVGPLPVAPHTPALAEVTGYCITKEHPAPHTIQSAPKLAHAIVLTRVIRISELSNKPN
jgi:hypothetical protein